MKKIKSGRRDRYRLELGEDIFKHITISGKDFENTKVADVSHEGIGIIYTKGVNTLDVDQKVNFSIFCDNLKVDVTATVMHASSKLVGFRFDAIHCNREEFFHYIDSRVVNKFSIPTPAEFSGILVKKIDVKALIFIMIIEAIIMLALGYALFKPVQGPTPERPLEGNHRVVSNTTCIS